MLKFPWFNSEAGYPNADEVTAYTTLITQLCKTAKEKHRITAKEKDVDANPKYAMQCFLLSLGFIGAEYKTARKILLSRLDGNSSWKSGVPTHRQSQAIGEDSLLPNQNTQEPIEKMEGISHEK